jgi:glutaredoxin-like protein
MAMIKESDRTQVREMFASDLQRPVKLALFTTAENCQYCDVVRDLLTEVAELSDRLSLKVYDLEQDAARAAELGIDKAPGFAVLGENDTDYGIRFYGLPSGYEFTSLLEALRTVGGAEVQLQAATQKFLEGLTTPLHLQVFVTPTCPYCPQAVVLAHKLAHASPLVTADMVEVMEFPELGDRYDVMGVPRTVISDVTYFEGAMPESALPRQLQAAVDTLTATV